MDQEVEISRLNGGLVALGSLIGLLTVAFSDASRDDGSLGRFVDRIDTMIMNPPASSDAEFTRGFVSHLENLRHGLIKRLSH